MTQNTTRAHRQMSVCVAAEIPAPPETVFACPSDLENNSKWNWAVIAHDPPRLLEVGSELEQGCVRYRLRLAALGRTATRLEVRVELPPTSRPGVNTAPVGVTIATNLKKLGILSMETRAVTVVGDTR